MHKQIDFFDQLTELRRQRPFKPFTIGLENGERFKVTDPFHIAWALEGPIVVLFVPRRDRFMHFTKDQVKDVQPGKTRGDGRRSR